MNDRILQLYKETTGKDWVYDFDPDYAEKFAELIIRECAQKLEDDGMVEVAMEIKEYFRVE